ncbi:MAG TPA: hypothetical protein VGI20_00330 [Rhizomicrobium sp.]|jgi:hypothetical protein
MSIFTDFAQTIGTVFGWFDVVTIAIMLLVCVGAGFMMTGMGSIVTATFGALIVFTLASFARAALLAGDTQGIARSDWHDFLALPLHTIAVYSLVFGVTIAIIYGLRMLVQR